MILCCLRLINCSRAILVQTEKVIMDQCLSYTVFYEYDIDPIDMRWWNMERFRDTKKDHPKKHRIAPYRVRNTVWCTGSFMDRIVRSREYSEFLNHVVSAIGNLISALDRFCRVLLETSMRNLEHVRW